MKSFTRRITIYLISFLIIIVYIYFIEIIHLRLFYGKQKENAVERLLKSYRRFYNITRFDGGISPPLEEGRNLREAVKLSPFREDERNGLAAVCEYYEKTGQHLFLKSNEIWSANQEEFIFLFTADHLTADLFERCRDYAYNAGMEMAISVRAICTPMSHLSLSAARWTMRHGKR